MSKRTSHWNDMYAMDLNHIPWEIENPPADLTEFIENGTIIPCRTLDVGCGTGNYSIYLAQQGFAVTGIDPSERAIKIAKKRAHDANISIDFLCSSAEDLPKSISDPFDFILEYSLLHHIPDESLSEHIDVYKKMLKPGGRLLIICYSDDDPNANGQRTMIGNYGNTMYFRSSEEIRDACRGLTEIDYTKTTLGKRGQHRAHRFLFLHQ